MKVGTRIGLLVGLAVAGVILLGAIYFIGQSINDSADERRAAAEHIHDTVAEIATGFLNARRHEKDFLLRQDEKHATKLLNETAPQVSKAIENMARQAPQNNRITVLRSGFDNYLGVFRQMVATYKTLGLDDTEGLEGTLNTVSHRLESRLSTVEAHKLDTSLGELFQNHKDYLLRREAQFAEMFEKERQNFAALIPTSGLPVAEQTALRQALDEYAATFQRYVSTRQQLDGQIKALIDQFAAVQPVLDEIADGAQRDAAAAGQEADSVAHTVKVLMLTSVLAIAAAVAVLGWLIARAIVTPITSMTGAMTTLAGGRLDVTVPALDRTDEIGDMAQAVQVFKQNAVDKQRMEEEAEAARQAQAQAEAEQRAREAAIVAEVAEVASAASQGDLERSIDLAGKDGFLLDLCRGVNNLVSQTGIALKDVAGVLGSVARGDLTRRITNEYKGLFGELKADVNQTADKLFEIVTNINSAANQIGSAASEVAAGSQDLSQRSEQQASALEETAASMEELATTVRQNASNAQQANVLATEARDKAAVGGEVVGTAIAAMDRIEQSSQKIEDIVGMIDEIAFQTNLLALNAAVEAARAGDAGKGFAVVAQEVRNLAQRSAQASKEIKTLIAESSTQVQTGAELVKGGGKTLEDILASVKRVADIVAEIAAASSEQAAGIDQVNAAVTQMDEMTQQNAALVEESAAAAHALEEQSRELNRLMGFFDTGAPAATATPVATAPRGESRPAAKTKPAAKPTPKPKLAAAPKQSARDWSEF